MNMTMNEYVENKRLFYFIPFSNFFYCLDDVLVYIRSLERKLGLSPDPVEAEEVQGDSWGTRPQAVSNAFKVIIC